MTETRQSRGVTRWVSRLLILTCLAAGAWGVYAYRVELLTGAAEYLDVSEPPRKADYVFVLGGGADTRPFLAARLVKDGLAGKALLAGMERSPEAEDGLVPPEEELARQVLRAEGVAAEDITVLKQSTCTSTRDEAQVLNKFLGEHPETTALVVTNGFHTRRASRIFASVLGGRAGRVRFVGVPTDGFDATNWWHFEEGVVTYSNEYCKLVLQLLGG